MTWALGHLFDRLGRDVIDQISLGIEHVKRHRPHWKL